MNFLLTACYQLNKDDISIIQASKMWIYMRMLRIPWVDRVTNEEVLSEMNKDVEESLLIPPYL